MNDKIIISEFEAPCGKLVLGDSDGRLCLCDWLNGRNHAKIAARLLRMSKACIEEGTTPLLERAARQLDEYFKAERRDFDLPLLTLGTDFQQSVWNNLQKIAYGKTISYKAYSELLGKPKAIRAIGVAIGDNPLSIILPCHRVIGSDGSLVGYGGGINVKKYLLNFENPSASASLWDENP